MRIGIFIISIVFTIIRVWLVEARHDYEVARMREPGKQSLWKVFGNINEMTQLAVPIGILSIFMGTAYLMLFPILMFVWWVVHDVTLGLLLTGNPWHLGSGWFDQQVSAIFQTSGKIAFGYKIFVLIILSGIYFAL